MFKNVRVGEEEVSRGTKDRRQKTEDRRQKSGDGINSVSCKYIKHDIRDLLLDAGCL